MIIFSNQFGLMPALARAFSALAISAYTRATSSGMVGSRPFKLWLVVKKLPKEPLVDSGFSHWIVSRVVDRRGPHPLFVVGNVLSVVGLPPFQFACSPFSRQVTGLAMHPP